MRMGKKPPELALHDHLRIAENLLKRNDIPDESMSMEMAKWFADKSNARTTDDVTVLVTEVKPHHSKIMAVFDGHGRQGDVVAERSRDILAEAVKLRSKENVRPSVNAEFVSDRLRSLAGDDSPEDNQGAWVRAQLDRLSREGDPDLPGH
jgi:hypothetical protein